LNCAAFASGLLESELFGYVKGAFTGAQSGGAEGKLAAARGGTLFLDELAMMPEAMQVALLRVLEDGSYYRVGDNQVRKADVRVVCATGDDLPALVREGRFRKDLFYRINGACLRLPPLRARDDRVQLSRALLTMLAREVDASANVPELSEGALAWIEQHPWPGNVRELKTALQHGLVLAGPGGTLERWHLPEDNLYEEQPPSSAPRSRRDAERDAFERALAAAGGNLSDAARRLGVARTTLYRLMQRHGFRE
jgi:transcriptional regulator with PAS, ATPase and Fis domain